MRRNSWRVLAGAVGALVLSACSTFPDAPSNMPPPLSLAERTGTTGVLRSETVEAVGQAVVAVGVVTRDSPMISIPYRYKHTAVLTEDVTGFSITVSGVQAPKGSPGFYAGTFAGGAYARGPSDMWCFLPRLAGGSRDSICLLRNQPGIAAIAPTRLNPYMWSSFSPLTGSFDYVNTPIFERREVAIPGDLKLEYRFAGWSRAEVEIDEYAVGRQVRRFQVQRGADGSAQLATIAGVLHISPASGDPNGATVTLALSP